MTAKKLFQCACQYMILLNPLQIYFRQFLLVVPLHGAQTKGSWGGGSCRQPCGDSAPSTSRPAPAPCPAGSHSQSRGKCSPLSRGPATTDLGTALQPNWLGPSDTYQHVQSGQPGHNKRAHTAHIGGTLEHIAPVTRKEHAPGYHRAFSA